MKVLVLTLLAVASFAVADNVNFAKGLTAYGYLTRYGIPKAERIRKLEENAASRIVGGVPAGDGQYPYQAGLITSIVGTTGRGVCGGSLVSANRVITAAHCWYDGNNQGWQVEVVLGSRWIFQGGQRMFTSAVATHPNWFPMLIRNDVAVIYLPDEALLSNHIQPVALPTGSMLNEDFAGQTAIASGFGLTSDSHNSIPVDQILHHVRLTVLSNSVCSIFFLGVIQDSNICTSGLGGVGTCSGDSGGPLVVSRNGQHYMIGVVSFGFAIGCEFGLPAAYARTTSFMDFFNQHIY